ncbi:hypothetical protein [Chrysiogenes arsenatis]|uniref:hypothetical protein n=1 Tax=Chrysiogenes arsenatis TaxID=309797 RepID=UPI000485FECC|nr:hypothetical protein [Chrysiogenes arsenatis]
MKKVLLTSLVAFTALSTIALAYPGKGNGGYGAGGCGCPQGGPNAAQQQAPELSDADARTAIDEYVNANLKGYTVGAVQSYATPRGAMFTADVTDASGNNFVLHVNPWGTVRGPFLPRS